MTLVPSFAGDPAVPPGTTWRDRRTGERVRVLTSAYRLIGYAVVGSEPRVPIMLGKHSFLTKFEREERT